MQAGDRFHGGSEGRIAGCRVPAPTGLDELDLVRVQAAHGLQTTTGELAAARRLDAEDSTMRQVLAWAMDHDGPVAVRLAVALAPWWLLRGRAQDGYPLLRSAAGHAEVGGQGWCAAQYWLGQIALDAPDLAGALTHFTAVRDAIGDRGRPGPWPPAWAAGRTPWRTWAGSPKRPPMPASR